MSQRHFSWLPSNLIETTVTSYSPINDHLRTIKSTIQNKNIDPSTTTSQCQLTSYPLLLTIRQYYVSRHGRHSSAGVMMQAVTRGMYSASFSFFYVRTGDEHKLYPTHWSSTSDYPGFFSEESYLVMAMSQWMGWNWWYWS